MEVEGKQESRKERSKGKGRKAAPQTSSATKDGRQAEARSCCARIGDLPGQTLPTSVPRMGQSENRGMRWSWRVVPSACAARSG